MVATGRVDVAVLTVIPEELEAAQSAFGIDPRTRVKDTDGSVYFRTAVRSELAGRDYEVVLGCIGGAGNPGAAVAADSILKRYQPRALLLTGIAAGVRGKVRIGDVVFSERVVAYEGAAHVRVKGKPAAKPRPEIDRAPHALLQDVHAYRAAPERLTAAFLRAGGKIPEAPAGKEAEFREHVANSIEWHLGTIAAGEKLLRDPQKLGDIREKMHAKTEAGEMEAVGVVEACRRRNVPWLVVRGISDFGDDLKDDRFHVFAARTAATVLADFVTHGLELDATAEAGVATTKNGAVRGRRERGAQATGERGIVVKDATGAAIVPTGPLRKPEPTAAPPMTGPSPAELAQGEQPDPSAKAQRAGKRRDGKFVVAVLVSVVLLLIVGLLAKENRDLRAATQPAPIVLFGSGNVRAFVLGNTKALDTLDPLWIDSTSGHAVDQIFRAFSYGRSTRANDRSGTLALSSSGHAALTKLIEQGPTGDPSRADNYFLSVKVAMRPLLVLYREGRESETFRLTVKLADGSASGCTARDVLCVQHRHPTVEALDVINLYKSTGKNKKALLYVPEENSGTRATFQPIIDELDKGFGWPDGPAGSRQLREYGNDEAFLAIISELPLSEQSADPDPCTILKNKHMRLATISAPNQPLIFASHAVVMKVAKDRDDIFTIRNNAECKVARYFLQNELGTSCQLTDRRANASHVVERTAENVVDSLPSYLYCNPL